jgi:electron transport complex protein RnfD
MTNWVLPGAVPLILPPDLVTGATPLAILSKGTLDAMPGIWDLFLGVHGGCIGETSELMLLLGGAYLLIRRIISWHAPLAFIAVVFIATALAGANPLHHIFSGGLFLGAIFMATDYVTTPMTKRGRLIFGTGAGLLTVLIRLYGSFPEGVSFAILLMNTLVPYINKLTMRKALGGIK